MPQAGGLRRASRGRRWRSAAAPSRAAGSGRSSCPSWALAQLGSSGFLHLRDPRRPRGDVLPRPLPHLPLRPRRARDRRLPHRTRRHGPRPRAPPRLRLALRPARSGAASQARPPRRRRRPPGTHQLHPGAREPLLLRPRRRRRRLPAGRRRSGRHGAAGPARSRPGLSRGVFPRVQARLAGEGFQGEDKTLALELMPLRYDASRGALVLSRRLTVRVDFAGAEPSEIGRGRLGRRIPRARPDSSAYAFLAHVAEGPALRRLRSRLPRTLPPPRARLAETHASGECGRTSERGQQLFNGPGTRGRPVLRRAPGPHLRARQPALLPRGRDRFLHLLRSRGRLRSRARDRRRLDEPRPRSPGRLRPPSPRAASPPSRPTASSLPTSSTSRTRGSGSRSAPG